MQETTEVGNVIRRIRKARKLSQETVAFESGINRSHLSQIERGVQQPTIGTLLKLARALEVSPVTIMALVEESSSPEVPAGDGAAQSFPQSHLDKLERELEILLDLLSPESRTPFMRFIRAHWHEAYRKGGQDERDRFKKIIGKGLKTIEHNLSDLAKDLDIT